MGIQITKVLKSDNIPNLFLLYGSESYLKRQFRDKIIDALLPGRDSMNYTKFINNSGKVDESNSIFNELVMTAQTYPVFSKCRVILCENSLFFKNKFEGFSDFLKTVPDFTYIIFVEREINKATSAYKTISKLGFCEEYNIPERADLSRWIDGKVRAAGLSIDSPAKSEFIGRTSINMENMDNELSKLISYCLNKGKITLSDVSTICLASYEEQIFNIINAIAKRDKKTALKEYTYLYNLRTNPRSIFALLTKRFLQMYNIQMGLDCGMDSKALGANLGIKSDYAFKRSLENVKYFNKKSLKDIISLSAEYHQKMNTGLLHEQTGIEMFILKSLEL